MSDPAATDPSPAAPVETLPPNVRRLGWVSFAQDAASEAMYPLLPLFVVGTLAAPPVALGLIEGLADGTAAAAKLATGRLADTRRRRPFITAGYGLAAVGKLLVVVAAAWPAVLAGRFVDRIGKGVRGAPRDAIIADETPPALRGRAFGLHRSMDTAGAVVGPLLALAAYHLLDGRIRWVLAMALVPALVSVALTRRIHERPRALRPSPGSGRLDLRGLGSEYWRTVTPLAAFALVNSSDTFLLLRAGELGLGVTGVALVYVLTNLVAATLALPAGRLSDRVPRQRLYAAGLVVFAVVYVGMGLTTRGAWVWLWLPLYGAFAALTDAVGKAVVVDVSPADRRASALGAHQALLGGGALVSGVWTGALWGADGRVPLVVAGLGALLLAPVVARRH